MVGEAVRGELTTAQEIAEQIASKAEREGDAAGCLWGQLTAGICAFYRGDFTAAHTYCVETTHSTTCSNIPNIYLTPKC